MAALVQAPVPAALPAGRAAAGPADLLAGHVVRARLDQRQVKHAGHVPAQVVLVGDGAVDQLVRAEGRGAGVHVGDLDLAKGDADLLLDGRVARDELLGVTACRRPTRGDGRAGDDDPVRAKVGPDLAGRGDADVRQLANAE
jgi:hypothetical protein